MWLEGRHQAHKTLDVPTRLLHLDPEGRAPIGGTDIRVAVDKLRGMVNGKIPLSQILIPEMSPDLTQRALQVRQIMTEIANEAGLPQYQRIEQYWPHFFSKSSLGDKSYYNLPFDMNVGDEVFFRFFQPRRHPELQNYEIDMRQVFDMYLRGAMRKASFDPLIQEFNSPQVRNVLPTSNANICSNSCGMSWVNLVLTISFYDRPSQPSSAPHPSWGSIKWLRRAVLASDRPAYALAHVIRGWQFLRTLGFNVGWMATNLEQAPTMYLMRNSWAGYADVLMKSGLFRDSVISNYFESSHIAGEIRRSDIALASKRQRFYQPRPPLGGRAVSKHRSHQPPPELC